MMTSVFSEECGSVKNLGGGHGKGKKGGRGVRKERREEREGSKIIAKKS